MAAGIPGLGRALMVVPDLQRGRQPRPDRRSAAGGAARRRRLVVDDRSPDGTGADRRRLATPTTGRPRAAPHPKEGLGAAYLAGFRWALERGLRRDRRDGRRRLAPARAAASAARRAPARRPGDRLALGPGRQHRQLAAEPRAALPRRQLLHAAAARHQGARRHGRLPPVPSYDAGGDRPRRSSRWATSSRPTWPSARVRAGLRVSRCRSSSSSGCAATRR